MKSSQMPEEPRERMGWTRPSQRLKSPTTLTRRALGAQTAKCTPADAVDRFDMRAEFFVGVVMAAFAHQIKIKFGEEKREGVGVVGFEDFVVFRAKPNAIAGRGRSKFTDARAGRPQRNPRDEACASASGSGAAFVSATFPRATAQEELRFDGAAAERNERPSGVPLETQVDGGRECRRDRNYAATRRDSRRSRNCSVGGGFCQRTIWSGT